jgi:hypothetical protein
MLDTKVAYFFDVREYQVKECVLCGVSNDIADVVSPMTYDDERRLDIDQVFFTRQGAEAIGLVFMVKRRRELRNELEAVEAYINKHAVRL